MIENKFDAFDDNDTNCNYVIVRWDKTIEDKVNELKTLYGKIKSNVEVLINFDFLYIYHLEEFKSINSCENSFLGYDGENYYLQIYFYPIQNEEVLSDIACISFAVPKQKIVSALNFFEMEYHAAIG
jgi:hypothetical protein